MDPASASIAFVGLGASILTIAAAAAESLRALHNLWKKLKDAPASSRRLVDTVETVKHLIDLLAKEDEVVFSQGLRHLWNRQASQLETVFTKLKNEASALEKLLQKSSISRRQVRLRVLHFFNQDGIEKYQKILGEQVQFLTLLLSMSTS